MTKVQPSSLPSKSTTRTSGSSLARNWASQQRCVNRGVSQGMIMVDTKARLTRVNFTRPAPSWMDAFLIQVSLLSCIVLTSSCQYRPVNNTQSSTLLRFEYRLGQPHSRCQSKIQRGGQLLAATRMLAILQNFDTPTVCSMMVWL
jgi:hypothetical protein